MIHSEPPRWAASPGVAVLVLANVLSCAHATTRHESQDAAPNADPQANTAAQANAELEADADAGAEDLADTSFEADLASGRVDLTTFAGIDALLEGHDLLPLGAPWRYFPGTAEPSPALEWTTAEFDDSAWRVGPSPFLFGVEGPGTVIEEMAAGVTTVYLRSELVLPEPSNFARILLELPIDDGFVFYLNGAVEGRRGVTGLGARPAFDAAGRFAYATDDRPLPTVDLTPAVVSGSNRLGLQGIVSSLDPETFAILPRVRVVHLVTPEGERERFEALQAHLAGTGEAALLAYLEGRHFQRTGDPERALPALLRAAQWAPGRPEPLQRLTECHLALGSADALEASLRERIEAGEPTAALLDAWAALFLGELGRSPLELVAALPDVQPPPDSVLFADAAWLGGELAAGRTARIDCGAADDLEHDGVAWGRDRFFAPASSARSVTAEAEGGDGGGLGAQVRVAQRSLDDVSPTYSIPLPAGAYLLRAHLSTEGAGEGGAGEGGAGEGEFVTSFDLLVNNARAVRAFEPHAQEQRPGSLETRVPLFVSGGFLELDLLPASDFDPWIAGIEIEPLTDDQFLEGVQAWIEAEGPWRALPHVQLARFLSVRGPLHEALAAYEFAEQYPDFQAQDREDLASLRRELLPELLSFASVDGLLATIEPAKDDGVRLLREAKEAESGFAAYLVARIAQMGGQFDEAIAGFEALVVEGVDAPEPYLRMAQCLAEFEFAEEAEGLLAEALSAGIPASEELLSYWIALQVGPLGSDPWAVIENLRGMEVPEQLVVAPTSEEAPQLWSYSAIEPPTVTWSRLAYDVDHWERGFGALGAGRTPAAIARSLWNTETLFARRTVSIGQPALLYPHLRVRASDALDVYLNGTRALSLGIPVEEYRDFPLRASAVVPLPNARDPLPIVVGDNGLGMYANNPEDSGVTDVGIVQPLGLLFWIADRLAQDGALRINCGGDAFVAPDGAHWSSDRFFGWGQLAWVDPELPLPDIANTDNDTLYHTNRWFFHNNNTTWYQVPLPNGRYRVTLHFAEIEPDRQEPGKRVFDVRAEGEVLLEDYDVFAAVGYEAADVHTFEVAVEDGFLDLHLGGSTSWSFLCGLEIAR